MSESYLLVSNKDAIWHHHFHFGHLSFFVLKTMFPCLRALMLEVFIVMSVSLQNTKGSLF